MMYVIVLVTFSLLGCCSGASVQQARLADLDNDIDSIGITKATGFNRVAIAEQPKPVYEHRQGETLNLVCEGIGSPAPSVRWFKNDAPVYEYDMESNEAVDSSPYAVGRVASTLLVTRSKGRDRYTCLVTAGDKTARATTVVYSKDGNTDLSERTKLYPLAPRVVAWYKVYLDTIGSDVVLPCRVKGHPRPRVSWKDNKGNLVKNDARMKVLRSGDLVISSLRWSDMGEFTCNANNIFGSDVAKTFLYPAKPS